MNPHLTIIDLSSVIAMLMSFGGASGLLSYLRGAGLDTLLSGLDATQRDYLLRGLNFLLNVGLILGLSVSPLFAQPLDFNLLVNVLVAAAAASGLGHITFHMAVNAKNANANAEPSYPEIPADDPTQLPPSPTPPDDAPQSAALTPAA